MTIPFVLTNESITLTLDNKVQQVLSSAANYKAVRKALLDGDWAKAKKALSLDNVIADYAGELPPELKERAKEMLANGEDPAPLWAFWARLKKNPSYRSVEQLWRFLQQRGIPLTRDGYFLAYKGVSHGLKDKHTGTFDNSPGVTHELPRNKVSDDPQVECHEGFHVGALEYARNFGERVVICRVDPEHVVSVPLDHQSQKMRVCKYTVVGFFSGDEMPSTTIADEQVPKAPKKKKKVTQKPSKAKKGKKPSPAKGKLKSFDELMEMPMDQLRSYAVNVAKVVGAGHIKGGKAVLASHILGTRGASK